MNRKSMILRNVVFPALFFFGFAGNAYAADASLCTNDMAMRADAAASPIKDWDALYSVYKSYAVCDSGAAAEGFSDSVAKLFVDHWTEFGKFASLAEKDDDFKYFAIGHIDETDDMDDLVRIASNAQKSCPAGQDKLCETILNQAKYPDVNGWLSSNAWKQKVDGGGSIGYYSDYNTYVIGDISGDGRHDLAVAYTLEGVRGGTDWLRYVALFLASSDPKNHGHDYCCTYQIGGKGIATEDKIEIKHRQIVIIGKAYVDGKDAYCCPSKPMSIRLKVVDGKLIEVKEKK